jgi:tetratricopeptide (TPR) repeat protein/GR25 family glycosyltransferase involved in LPS biosynthesis
LSAPAPRLYCINLAASVERRQRMERRLAHHDLLRRTRFVTAIPASAGGLELDLGGSPDNVARAKDRAGSACFASHLKAIRAFLRTRASGAIICEDDVLLHNSWHELLSQVLANLPADAPLCSLGYLIDHWDAAFAHAGRVPERENLFRMLPCVWSTHMYWISRAYADAVLSRHDGPVDELPSMTEHITQESNGYISFPPLALQDAIDSTIRPPEEMDFHLRALSLWPYHEYSACEEGLHASPLAPRPSGRRGRPRRPTVALCMIVRDEAAVIERCLRSVRDLIDGWVICDTGSTDGTPELIRDALSNLPGALHEQRWRDFGWNRSEMLRLARGAADYLLLLDADHTLRIVEPPPPLTADAYLLRHAGDLEYAVPRLVRGDRRWWYEGSTHEYLATEGLFTQERLDELVVEHHADGRSRETKLDRDRRLLDRDLRQDPGNARAAFYLAQTYRDLGDAERAIELYQRRIDLGGWDEEVFYAAYQAGSLLARQDPEAAIPALEEAWRLRPSRAEPLYELARLCRFLGRHDEAHSYAKRGLETPYPDDLLFVHRPVYEWGVRFEYSIAAYWVGELAAALDANNRLLDGDLPDEIESAVRENRSYCLAALARRRGGRRAAGGERAHSIATLAPSTRLGEIRLDVSPAWPQFNPTIAADGHGYRLIVRTANYVLERGWYRFLDDDAVIRTLNYVVWLDRGLEIVDVRPLVDRSSGPPMYDSRVQGYEDCRLVRLGETWLATATTRDRNPQELCEVALLTLDDAVVTDVHVLEGPTPGRHEKNWMPFVADGALHVLYSCEPTVVFRCDPKSGTLERVARHQGPREAAAFRGGSQGIPTESGFLFVVHEAAHANGRREYLHRFVLLDRAHRLAAVSPHFRFAGPGTEFCAGLARRDADLLLTFGVGDRAAGLAVVAADEALASLEPVRRR